MRLLRIPLTPGLRRMSNFRALLTPSVKDGNMNHAGACLALLPVSLD